MVCCDTITWNNMRKNIQEVFNAWKQGKSLNRKSISTDGKTIYSYSTLILKDGVLNTVKYSKTTSRQQSAIALLLQCR